MAPMEWDLERQDFATSFSKTQLFLMEGILHVLGVSSHAAFLLSLVAICRNLFSSRNLVRLFFSPAFLLVVVHAVFTHILSCECIASIAYLYCNKAHFRARALAVLAGLRKRAVLNFFTAVAVVGGYVVALFWWVEVPGELDLPLVLLGGAEYLAATAYVAAVRRLDLAAGGSLSFHRVAQFSAATLVFLLLYIMSVDMAAYKAAVAVQLVLPSQAMEAELQCTVVLVTAVLRKVVYRVWRDSYRSSFYATTLSLHT